MMMVMMSYHDDDDDNDDDDDGDDDDDDHNVCGALQLEHTRMCHLFWIIETYIIYY